MTTYDYEITNLVRDANDIVVTATFTITAGDGVDEFTHTYTTGFANNPLTPTPFAGITEAKVLEWIVRDAGDQNQFEASADAELAAYKQRKTQGTSKTGIGWVKRANGVKLPKPVKGNT
jgi:hypothetical protein